MKKLIILLVMLLPSLSWADASCTDLTTCQAVINSAVDGDVITLTQNASFGSSLTISKGIHFRGSTPSINISGAANPKIAITRDATHSVQISNLTFSSGGTLTLNGAGKPPLIHDCIFNHGSTTFAIRIDTGRGGVFYKNTFNATGSYIADYAIAHKVIDLSDWQTASTMGTDDTTGENNVYFEGNTFNLFTVACFDLDDSSRMVLRWNTFNNSAIAGHGFCTSAVGVRHWEIINNAFAFTYYGDSRGNVANGWIRPRGGTGVITGNTFADITGWGTKPDFTFSEWMLGTGQGGCGQYPGGCCTSYPCTRQSSVSHNGSIYTIDPVYIWGNTPASIDLSLDGNTPYCGSLTIGDVIQLGRNYVLSAKPAYTQYTCPHPLAGAGSCNPSIAGSTGYTLTAGSPPTPTLQGVTIQGGTIR